MIRNNHARDWGGGGCLMETKRLRGTRGGGKLSQKGFAVWMGPFLTKINERHGDVVLYFLLI